MLQNIWMVYIVLVECFSRPASGLFCRVTCILSWLNAKSHEPTLYTTCLHTNCDVDWSGSKVHPVKELKKWISLPEIRSLHCLVVNRKLIKRAGVMSDQEASTSFLMWLLCSLLSCMCMWKDEGSEGFILNASSLKVSCSHNNGKLSVSAFLCRTLWTPVGAWLHLVIALWTIYLQMHFLLYHCMFFLLSDCYCQTVSGWPVK